MQRAWLPRTATQDSQRHPLLLSRAPSRKRAPVDPKHRRPAMHVPGLSGTQAQGLASVSRAYAPAMAPRPAVPQAWLYRTPLGRGTQLLLPLPPTRSQPGVEETNWLPSRQGEPAAEARGALDVAAGVALAICLRGVRAANRSIADPWARGVRRPEAPPGRDDRSRASYRMDGGPSRV